MDQDEITVLIVDDHTIVRRGLKAVLSVKKYGIDIIDEACNGDEAVQKAAQLNPDVILMDLVMPEKSGLEAIREIKKMKPEARILVLTSYADDDNVAEALRIGAYGFLLKDTSPADLVQTIRSVYANKLTIPQELAHILLGVEAGKEPQDADTELLTERELDVIRCIAQGMSNKQVAQTLSISVATVRSHVTRMIRKLGVENRTQLAIYARENDLA